MNCHGSIIDYNNDNIITYIDIISCNLFYYLLLKEHHAYILRIEKISLIIFFLPKFTLLLSVETENEIQICLILKLLL